MDKEKQNQHERSFPKAYKTLKELWDNAQYDGDGDCMGVSGAYKKIETIFVSEFVKWLEDYKDVIGHSPEATFPEDIIDTLQEDFKKDMPQYNRISIKKEMEELRDQQLTK